MACLPATCVNDDGGGEAAHHRHHHQQQEAEAAGRGSSSSSSVDVEPSVKAKRLHGQELEEEQEEEEAGGQQQPGGSSSLIRGLCQREKRRVEAVIWPCRLAIFITIWSGRQAVTGWGERPPPAAAAAY